MKSARSTKQKKSRMPSFVRMRPFSLSEINLDDHDCMEENLWPLDSAAALDIACPCILQDHPESPFTAPSPSLRSPMSGRDTLILLHTPACRSGALFKCQCQVRLWCLVTRARPIAVVSDKIQHQPSSQALPADRNRELQWKSLTRSRNRKHEILRAGACWFLGPLIIWFLRILIRYEAGRLAFAARAVTVRAIYAIRLNEKGRVAAWYRTHSSMLQKAFCKNIFILNLYRKKMKPKNPDLLGSFPAGAKLTDLGLKSWVKICEWDF